MCVYTSYVRGRVLFARDETRGFVGWCLVCDVVSHRCVFSRRAACFLIAAVYFKIEERGIIYDFASHFVQRGFSL